MSHENSETVQDELGRWWNVYGEGAEGGLQGSLLPISPWAGAPPTPGPYRTEPEASAAAQARSKAHPRTTGVLWMDLVLEALRQQKRGNAHLWEGIEQSYNPLPDKSKIDVFPFLGLPPVLEVPRERLKARSLAVPLPSPPVLSRGSQYWRYMP